MNAEEARKMSKLATNSKPNIITLWYCWLEWWDVTRQIKKAAKNGHTNESIVLACFVPKRHRHLVKNWVLHRLKEKGFDYRDGTMAGDKKITWIEKPITAKQ